MGAGKFMQDDLHDHESGRLPHHSRFFYLLLRLRDWIFCVKRMELGDRYKWTVILEMSPGAWN